MSGSGRVEPPPLVPPTSPPEIHGPGRPRRSPDGSRRRRRWRAGPRAEATACLVLFGLLVVVPSSNSQTFDGLPASRLPEFLALALLAPFVLSRLLRRAYARLLAAVWPVARRALLVLGVVALAAKLVLLASGTHAGFLACYRSPFAPPPTGPCEKSYENPFARFGATRIDRYVDFVPGTWDLSFVNSLRFNIYDWIKGSVFRARLPLAATWTGTVERARSWTAELHYVGTATIQLDASEPLRLAPRYDLPAVARVPMPAGRHDVTITYEFDDGARAGDGRQHGPYAFLRFVQVSTPPGGAPLIRPVSAVRPAGPWRWAARAGDVVVVLFAATLVATAAVVTGRELWVPASVALLAAAIVRHESAWPDAFRDGWLGLLLALSLGYLVRDPGPRRLLGAYLGLLAATLSLVGGRLGRLDVVEYRWAADDWLTYESFARSIMETWSLRGAESVFYYQPLFRYVRFAEHFVLGDGDPFILTSAIVALVTGIFWMMVVTLGRRRAPGRTAVFALTGLLLVGLATSPTVLNQLRWGVSEYPTWIALPWLLPMLFVRSSATAWLQGTSLLGLSLLTRTNQLPAVLVTLALFLWRGWRIRPRAAIGAGLLFGAIALLPALHNAYYGGAFVPLTTSAGIPENLVLPPGRLLGLAQDAEIRGRLRTQLERLLYLGGPDRVLAVAVRGLEVVWLASAGAALLTGRRGVPVALLVSLPLAYLVPHVLYQSAHAYPRHFLAGYIALGAVVLVAGAGWRALARPGRPGDSFPSGSPDRMASR